MSIRIIAIALCIIGFTTSTYAQSIIYGTNNYIEYHVGTLPYVISVGHGGSIEPSSIPDRTCNSPVYDVDAFTIETALEIKNFLFEATGCYPHLIISHLKRNKLDPNRNISDGACGNTEAETAWNEFHNFIIDAQNTANQQYTSKTFFVDLHGHGNPIQRIELGYLLYDNELEFTDNVLNTTQYINYSSIKNLANSNLNNYTHVQLLRGQKAFGTLLSNRNFPAVPSQSIPFPGTTTNYFSGGYITANHTCYASGVNINGLQMELNYTGIRDLASNRTLFANAFSDALIEYMNVHFNMTWNSCNPLSINEMLLKTIFELYPNPVKKGELFNVDNLEDEIYNYSIYNYLGQIIEMGQLRKSENTIDTKNLDSGIYLIRISIEQKGKTVVKKLIVD
jgi:hypothetical protein